MNSLCLFLAIAAATGQVTGQAPSLHDQATALENIVAKDENASPSLDESAIRYSRSISDEIVRNDFFNAIIMTKGIAQTDPSKEAQKAAAALIVALQKAQEAENAGVEEKLKPVLDDATNTIHSKTNLKDFDAVLAEIQTALDQSQMLPPQERQIIIPRLESVKQFVKQWQNYLLDKTSGNGEAANDLRNLAQGNDAFMPIPRSELLERALKESGVPVSIEGKIELHSLDDLPAAISQIEMLQRHGNFSQEANNIYGALQNLYNAYLAYQDQNYSGALQQLIYNYSPGFSVMESQTAGGSSSDQNSLHKELAALKNTLLLKVAQGLLVMPDVPAPQPDERASDYLLRLAVAREKAADWTGLQQVLQVYLQISPNSAQTQSWLTEDLAGLRAYLIGDKLEKAGQNLDAIRSYRQALATEGKFFPGDPPAAKLNQLQKQYPDLYKQALEQPIVPALSVPR